jgi:integrase
MADAILLGLLALLVFVAILYFVDEGGGFERGQDIVENRRGGRPAPTTVNSSVRTREYLTTAEIERLMAAARKSSRYGHRDATMILIGYRHGLRIAGSS